MELFTLNQKYYLVTVDYYSGYWELDRLHNTDSGTVVRKLKAHFARHGSLCQLVSDNGPQFVAAEFQKLTKEWDIEHRVTSPYNSKASGKVEAAVKSAKKNSSVKLLKVAVTSIWEYWLSAISHHKESEVVQFRGSRIGGQGHYCLQLVLSWNQEP